MTEENFDQLLKEMREDDAPPEQIAAARDRVWKRIASSGSLACAELQPIFAEYLAGRIADSRRLLVDDHLGRCAECRRELSEARGEFQITSAPRVRRSIPAAWTRWAIAAGVVLGTLYLERAN